ncbi:NAD(P)/FAD-dependent oxidoreductase [[Eubacterium] cellulosolvens]
MNYIIIGNGVAGTTAAERVREKDKMGNITIISDEEYPFYSRIRLIDYLAGTVDQNGLILKNEQWYRDNKIELLLNDPVEKIDKDGKRVTTRAGSVLAYDKLLLATGANAFVPPIPGSEKLGVFTLRRLRDANAILDYLQEGLKHVVVIGGGVLGLEAGNALRKTGHKITVIEAFPRLLPRQMDPKGSDILQKQLESMGFDFHIGKMTKEITGADKVDGVLLDDGTEISCDMIIISAGIRPELTLANQLGLKIDKGVMVDDNLSTEIPEIFCAGDLITHRNKYYGIWPASEKQGEVAGLNMLGEAAVYEGTIMSNILKVAGIHLVSIGDIDAESKHEAIVKYDSANFIYKKLVIDGNRIIGAILYGDKTGWVKVKRAVEIGEDIRGIKDNLENWELDVL